MNISNTSHISPLQGGTPSNREEDTAMQFERIFARQLVQELTKNLFEKEEDDGAMSGTGGLYKDQIVDTLSRELAAQRKLGMADMISRYLDGQEAQSEAESIPTDHD